MIFIIQYAILLKKKEGANMAIKYYKLLDKMNRQNIGKEELRKKIGVSSTTIAKISKNEYVSLEVINKICDVLDCQPGDILEFIRE